jgi:hypothetical protein
MEVMLFAGTIVMILLVVIIIFCVLGYDKLRRDIRKQHSFFTGRMDEIEGIMLNEFKNVLNQLKK